MASKDQRASFTGQKQTASSVAMKLMSRMGYNGGGLGKQSDGIVNPIQASTGYGKGRGLGCNSLSTGPEPTKNVSDIKGNGSAPLQLLQKRPRPKAEPIRHSAANTPATVPLKKQRLPQAQSQSVEGPGQLQSVFVHAVAVDIVSLMPELAWTNRCAWTSVLWDLLRLPSYESADGSNDSSAQDASYWLTVRSQLLRLDVDHLTDADALKTYEVFLRPLLQSVGLWDHAQEVMFPPMDQRDQYDYEEMCDAVISQKDNLYAQQLHREQQQDDSRLAQQRERLTTMLKAFRQQGIAIAVFHYGQRTRCQLDQQMAALVGKCAAVVSGANVEFCGTAISRPYTQLFLQLTQRLGRPASAMVVATANPYVALDACTAECGGIGFFPLPSMDARASSLWPSRCPAIPATAFRFSVPTVTFKTGASSSDWTSIAHVIKKDRREPNDGDNQDAESKDGHAGLEFDLHPASSLSDLEADSRAGSAALSACLAVFSEDHLLYPATISAVHRDAKHSKPIAATVVFEGYANTETVVAHDVLILHRYEFVKQDTK